MRVLLVTALYLLCAVVIAVIRACGHHHGTVLHRESPRNLPPAGSLALLLLCCRWATRTPSLSSEGCCRRLPMRVATSCRWVASGTFGVGHVSFSSSRRKAQKAGEGKPSPALPDAAQQREGGRSTARRACKLMVRGRAWVQSICGHARPRCDTDPDGIDSLPQEHAGGAAAEPSHHCRVCRTCSSAFPTSSWMRSSSRRQSHGTLPPCMKRHADPAKTLACGVDHVCRRLNWVVRGLCVYFMATRRYFDSFYALNGQGISSCACTCGMPLCDISTHTCAYYGHTQVAPVAALCFIWYVIRHVHVSCHSTYVH